MQLSSHGAHPYTRVVIGAYIMCLVLMGILPVFSSSEPRRILGQGQIVYASESGISLKRYTASGSFEELSAETIAELFDMSQSAPSSGVKIQQVHQIRPDYIALLYRNVRAVYPYSTDEYDKFRTSNWILRDSGGNYVYCKQYGYDNYQIIDFGNPDCQQWIANWIGSIINQYGFNGVFADNSLYVSTDIFWDTSAEPVNPRTGTYWTDAEVRQALIDLHRRIKQTIGSKILVANGIWTGNKFYQYEGLFVDFLQNCPLDGVMSEGTWFHYSMGQFQDFKKSLDFCVWMQDHFLVSSNRYFVPICAVGGEGINIPSGTTREQIYTYAFCSTLLAIKKANNFLGTRLGSSTSFKETVQALHRIDIGEPLGDYYKITGTDVYARNFSKVTVYVNPTAQTYTVDAIVINPYTGRIVLK
jgi:hypothetical protein